jgi:hypothetical protein
LSAIAPSYYLGRLRTVKLNADAECAGAERRFGLRFAPGLTMCDSYVGAFSRAHYLATRIACG